MSEEMPLLLVNETSTVDSDSSPVLNLVLFFVIICVSVPSIFINLFAIYRLHTNTKLSVFVFRCILHVSLVTTCTCIPFFLIELHYNSYFPLSPFVCKLWLNIDYASIVCLGLLVCWASIQRHILIFGPIHMKKLQSTLKFKLIPSVLALGFPLTWYTILGLTCTYENLSSNKFQCRPCFEKNKIIFLIDTILSLLIPLFVTIIATFLLLIRIIRLRMTILRLHSKRWRRCKRLTHQMILFSFIYLIGLIPYVVQNLNVLYTFWPFLDRPWCTQLADAFTYVPCCFSSFLSIYAFPEIWTHRRNRHRHHHHHRCSSRMNNRQHHQNTPMTSRKQEFYKKTSIRMQSTDGTTTGTEI